ncbi:MAG: hypothetical protein KBA96_06125 [Rhodocyclaceae bacterium]|nr:hypothetical protein [Rhodocyclaceae bacterium]MBP7080669.1 hypothetical protein [Rhodocyclaceae bacterium]
MRQITVRHGGLFSALVVTGSFLLTSAAAAPTDERTIAGTGNGSTAFCLYELPLDEFGRRRWINLGIVQYVEAKDLDLRIYYGGGSFGSGYEAKLVLAKPEDAAATIEKLRKTAAACR